MSRHLFVFLSFFILLSSSFGAFPLRGEASKTVTVSSNYAQVVEMVNQINETMLFDYHHGLMRFGPRYTGSLNCSFAAQYIYKCFQDMGLAVEYSNWSTEGFKSKNVVATLPGTDSDSTAYYILCGHYDTVPGAPGADDDGSGTAAVLAIAHVMSHYQFNHTIKFITFSGEEVGTYGSFTYARDASYRGDDIVAVLNMDMIGYANSTDGGRILRFFPPLRSHWIAEYATAIAEKYHDVIDMRIDTLPSYPGADNQAFVDYGYDGVWIAHQDGYAWGHSANDTADHLNWTYYVKATKLMCAVTAEFAQRPLYVQVLIRQPLEGYTYVFNRPVLQTSFEKQWYSGFRGITIIFGGKTIAKADVISEEPIKYVIFCVDGKFMVWDTEPPYEWTVQGMYFPLLGKHIIEVYAYTASGKVASDEMDISIWSVSRAYKG